MNLISISDLRQKVAEVVDRVATSQEPLVIMKRSKAKAVLVGHDYFISLEEAVFDLTDAIEAEKAKKEARIPLERHIKKRSRRR